MAGMFGVAIGSSTGDVLQCYPQHFTSLLCREMGTSPGDESELQQDLGDGVTAVVATCLLDEGLMDQGPVVLGSEVGVHEYMGEFVVRDDALVTELVRVHGASLVQLKEKPPVV